MTTGQLDMILHMLNILPYGNALAFIFIGLLLISIVIRIATGNKKNIGTIAISYFGSLLCGSITDKIDTMQSTLETKIDTIQEQSEKNAKDLADFKEEVFKDRAEDRRERRADRAKQLRSDILCFRDAITHNPQGYSQRHYENILSEMAEYARLCEETQIENHVLEAAEEDINHMYRELLKTNGFL